MEYCRATRTVDEVIIHLDTRQGRVMGKESWYVAISRARQSALVFTDDAEAVPKAIQNVLEQENAVEQLQLREQMGLEQPNGARRDGIGAERDLERTLASNRGQEEEQKSEKTQAKGWGLSL